MHFHTILMLLASITALVNAYCSVKSQTIERGYRIFTADVNNQLALLNTSEVQLGQSLYIVHPQNPNLVMIRKCMNRDFDRALPLVDQEPQVEEVTDTACVGPFKTYRVGYKFNTNAWHLPNLSGPYFLELYRSCYNVSKVQAKYTKHIIHRGHYRTSRPHNIVFQTGSLITQAVVETYKPEKIYERFNVLFGNKQTYIRNRNVVVINRGHLTPSNDFMFINDKVTTFRYMNVVPQFVSINGGNWRRIETWVNEHAQTNGPLEVITGTTGVLALPGEKGQMVPVYLGKDMYGNTFNPVPMFMYKKVRPLRGGMSRVMLTYNNSLEPKKQPPQFPGTCRGVQCPEMDLSGDPKEGFTVCCDPQTFVP